MLLAIEFFRKKGCLAAEADRLGIDVDSTAWANDTLAADFSGSLSKLVGVPMNFGSFDLGWEPIFFLAFGLMNSDSGF